MDFSESLQLFIASLIFTIVSSQTEQRCRLTDNFHGGKRISLTCKSFGHNIAFFRNENAIGSRTAECTVYEKKSENPGMYAANLECPVYQVGTYSCRCADDQDQMRSNVVEKKDLITDFNLDSSTVNVVNTVEESASDFPILLIIVGCIFGALLLIVPVGWFILRRRFRQTGPVKVMADVKQYENKKYKNGLPKSEL